MLCKRKKAKQSKNRKTWEKKVLYSFMMSLTQIQGKNFPKSVSFYAWSGQWMGREVAEECHWQPVLLYNYPTQLLGFPGGTVVKNLHVNAGDAGDMSSIPGSGRYPGERSGNPLQYSCMENPMDRGARWATVYRIAQSQTQPVQLNPHTVLGKGSWQLSLICFSKFLLLS